MRSNVRTMHNCIVSVEAEAVSARPINREDYAEAIGAIAAQIKWAMAAAEAGEMHNVHEFLRRAQHELLPVYPTMRLGPTDLYVPGIHFNRKHGPEAH